jgi:REP-associated tyrosine transposase
MLESPQATEPMAHSYSGNYVHIVFSTKDRRDTIPAELQEKLWAYLFGICKNLNITLLAVGGTANHVHVLISLSATIRLCDAIKELKANSSRWLGEHGINFEWQKGYGAFSVSPSNLEVVQTYIRNQAEHHKKRTFDDEFLTLLKKSGIPFVHSEALG